ncbi:hypothetical protein [Streptosporangium sp. OZ121]|uniref:hypothetical protein n=1 Tax=Streptosporangium sp. OZ121 TaxID=3444183 RepID=UPI003F7A6DF4
MKDEPRPAATRDKLCGPVGGRREDQAGEVRGAPKRAGGGRDLRASAGLEIALISKYSKAPDGFINFCKWYVPLPDRPCVPVIAG